MSSNVVQVPSAPLSRTRARLLLALGLLFVVAIEGGLVVLGLKIINMGRHIDAIRTAPGAQSTKLVVDRIDKICSKSCSYESIGHLTDTHGVTRYEVSVVPAYYYRNAGPITVVYSTRYPTEAIPLGNNGDGDYWFGGIVVGTFVLIDAGLLAFIGFRLRRRRRIRGVAGSGTESVELRGILHGPDFGTYSGPEHIRVTDLEIECRGHSIRLADVTNAAVSVHPVGVHGALYGGDWVTFVIDTASAQYYLTCSPDYAPLMRNRLPLNGKTRTVRVN